MPKPDSPSHTTPALRTVAALLPLALVLSGCPKRPTIGLPQALREGSVTETKANLFWEWDTGVNERVDKTGRTPLHIAAENGHEELVGYLIDQGAHVNAMGFGGLGATPLHLAAHKGHVEVCQQLLDAGASVYLPDSEGRTPMEVAHEAGREQVARLLAAHEESGWSGGGTD